MYIVKLTYVISNRASYMQVSKLLERRKKKDPSFKKYQIYLIINGTENKDFFSEDVILKHGKLTSMILEKHSFNYIFKQIHTSWQI